MYTEGGGGTAMFNGAYGLSAGGSYKGFSIDTIYQKESGAVAASPLSWTSCGPTMGMTCAANTLSATIADVTSWSIQGKYTYEFGGGFKDEGPSSKLTAFAGYELAQYANPAAERF